MEHLNKIIRVLAQRGHAKGGETKGKLMTLNIQNNKKKCDRRYYQWLAENVIF